MIWSVSMLVDGMTAVRDRMCVTAGMSVGCELARIGDATADRGCRRGFGACQQGARTRALASLEIAVAGADGIVPGGHEIAIHAEAHRAATLAPLGAGILEHLVEAFRLGGALHGLRSGHDQHLHALRELVTAQYPRDVAQ